MSLFDEIKRTLQEALDEAQGKPPAKQQPPQKQQQRRQAAPQQRAAPAPQPGVDQAEQARRQRHLQEHEKQRLKRERVRLERQAKGRLTENRAYAQQEFVHGQHRLHGGGDRKRLLAQLRQPGGLRQAVLLTEILGQPLAKRPRGGRRW